MVRRLGLVCPALALAGFALIAAGSDSRADELAGPGADQLRARASCETQLSNGKCA